MGQYKLAIKNFIKALFYSWKLKNKYQEIQIYEHIGLCFYYLRNLEIAAYFHDKFKKGTLEVESSSVYVVGIAEL